MTRQNGKTIIYYAFFPIAIIYMEIVLKIDAFKVLFDRGLIYTLFLSVAIGLLITAIINVFPGKLRRVVSTIMIVAITLLIGLQIVYFTIFKTFITLFSLSETGEVINNFWKDALLGIWKSAIPLLFLFVPLILHIIFWKRFVPEKSLTFKSAAVMFLAFCTVHLIGVLSIITDTTGIMSTQHVYSDMFSPILSIPRFGVLTTARLDLQDLISSSVKIATLDDIITSIDEQNKEETVTEEPIEIPIVYDANMLDIDFKELIANETDSEIIEMHKYFSTVSPTKKNEYTGMFEGKNLIWIVAEAFSTWAIDEEHTPTLAKLSSEGFVFENFYNPIWGVSTSDGEYVATTGLIPKTGVWSYSKSAENYMPFGFGNMFSDLGYESRAYHNHTYTYYHRDKSYPNMGYIYEGLGSGLDVEEQWPESDVEMIEKSYMDYMNKDQFMVYYLTVSGHLHYNFFGNMMCMKHEEEVSDLPYSDPARAYIACNMELDQAIELLIEKLDAAGKLEDTVIVLSGDHYPYGLEHETIEELNGGPVEKNFELHSSTLMIWNSEMETVKVDKYCSSLDIMPTLANLFGLEYDSRLVMGRDILSDSTPLVIFSNRSYITEQGRYNSSTDVFEVDEGKQYNEDYARTMLDVVNEKFEYSARILDNDYYQILFG